MTATATEKALETPPTLPPGAHGVFLGLSGIAFILLVAGLVGYGVYGARLTAGLDQACAEASLEAGRKLEADGNMAQALQKYRQALGGYMADEQERFRCGRAIGDILYREKRYNEALAAYRELPEGAFSTAGAYAGYVGALWQLGEDEEAVRLCAPWLSLATQEGNQEQEVWARKTLMRAADKRGDAAAALEQCQRIVALEPGNDAALYLAKAQQRAGDIAGARASIDAFLAVSDNPALRNSARKLLESLTDVAATAGQP